jgi:fatty acid synthase subunit alpha
MNGNLKAGKKETIPFLHLKRKEEHGWEYSKKLTGIYLEGLENAAKSGLTFQGKMALMTGAGAGSIGAEVLQGLISGGAKAIVTTSRFSREVTEYYQSMYARFGGRGSQLVVVPFNQGSKQDVEALIDYIYDPKKGLGWDLDFIAPFAAIPENGREIDSIDSKSELAHRIMLTNLIRLLGSVKTQKLERGFNTRPAQVILPLSPNHGTFGNDGLYSESKLALETLFNRWFSESWGDFLTICGAVIGWTRGTGLMSGNNIVADGVEKFGVRTFSQQEMAFNLLGLMSPAIVDLCQSEPVFADLNGGLQFLPDLNDLMTKLRSDIMDTSAVRQAVTKETALENKTVNGEDSEALYKKINVEPRANIKFDFPELPKWKEEIEPLNANLKGMVDLDKVVVVTGFSEVGPWGNSRTRWEMEAYGKFSLEGCVEMAWIMGLIKNHNGPLKGKSYSGWVDTKTNEPVDDKDVKAKYEKQILEHSGIRLIEPELFNGYDPNKKQLLQEIQIEEDLDPFEASKETSEEFKRAHGDKVEIFELESGEYSVRLKKSATLLVPKALRFDRLVAGQIPTGWNAKNYGIPDDIIDQVDQVTLFVLVCTVEALLASGITDPYEFYKYVHISEVGNCVGSGIGGTTALRGMYKDRFMDKPVQKDILQESFINTMSAWVNMLLMSSTGPIKTPVGACATAVESIDIGYETIVEGKARVCFVGGFDDFQEEGSYEFANMKATSNALDEFAHGRTPKEMSRPTTTTRGGFMESQGCGMQVIMSARLALDMGTPIYGILGLTTTATDKIGRSVPAPGQGVLTTARENPGRFPSPLLDIKYRKRQLDLRKKQIKAWQESELMYLQEEVAAMKTQAGFGFDESEYMQDRAEHIEREVKRQEKDAQYSLGNNFWRQDPRIAPLRGALATWGLTIDDLGVASFHGTSTVANDKNESEVLCKQMKHLGRKKGNALMGIFQKYLTGHPKGAAGAWMFNGCLQVLNSGLVPGNRNADNVDQVMEKFDYIVYPSKSLQTDGVKAFSVTSFGFGQKGAQAIGIHPKYLFATLDEAEYQRYKVKVEARQKRAYRYFHNGMINNTLFVAKTDPPYTNELESKVFLNPEYRVAADKKTAELTYPSTFPEKVETENSKSTKAMLESLTKANASEGSKVGVDVEDIKAINIENETFVERNFTQKEQEYCKKAPFPQASFAGRWSAKEAVFKSLGVCSKGAGAPLQDIEITSDENGAPQVLLHGEAAAASKKAGVKNVNVSISHSDTQAIAVAVSAF